MSSGPQTIKRRKRKAKRKRKKKVNKVPPLEPIPKKRMSRRRRGNIRARLKGSSVLKTVGNRTYYKGPRGGTYYKKGNKKIYCGCPS